MDSYVNDINLLSSIADS